MEKFGSFREKVTNTNSEKKLFTSDDGVDVYEDDKTYFVSIYTNDILGPDYFKGTHRDDSKYFSTLEAAQKWITEHRPLYDIYDMKRFGLHVEMIKCSCKDPWISHEPPKYCANCGKGV